MVEISSLTRNCIVLTTSLTCLVLVVACAAADIPSAADRLRTTWDGVYSLEQAARGQKLVELKCAVCHGNNLHGSLAAPAIAGLEMLFVWDGRTLYELLQYMRTSMPPGQVGTIDDLDFVDIIATILHTSGFPPGGAGDLSTQTEVLARIMIKREPAN